jgi:hypothetical protein
MMIRTGSQVASFLLTLGIAWNISLAADNPPKEEKIPGPNGLTIVVRMQGPYDADVSLQVVCYFKHKPAGDTTKGAPVELDKRLGGVIQSLRNRGEFVGDELETLLLDTRGAIPAKRLLLIGMGDDASLTLDRLERIGRIAYREAAKAGATVTAFAPLIRDQGNDRLPAGDVETAILRGLLLARDTDQRLQKEGFAKEFLLKTWIVEAGPAYYDETIAGVRRGLESAEGVIKLRNPAPYSAAP